MKITDIEITNEEMNTAVSEMLKLRGLDVIVESIEAKGYPRRSWQLDVTTTEAKKAVEEEELREAIKDINIEPKATVSTQATEEAS